MATLGQRLQKWTATILEFALAQGFVQAAGMLSGLIYVRVMPVEQYALYALCLSSLAVISVGSDLGISGALSYFWRKSLQEGSTIAPKVAMVRKLRALLFAGSMIVAAVLVATSATKLNIAYSGLLVCFGLVAMTAWLNVRIGIDILLVRLEGRQRQSYVFEAAGSAVRLGAAVTMLGLGMAAAWFGLAGGLLGAIATTLLLNRGTAEIGRKSGEPTQEDWRELRRYVLPLMPSVLVYMIQDPLVLWLTAVRGGATPVAEVHALGRIAAILALLGTFVVVVLTPRLAGIRDDVRFLRMGLFGLAPLLAVLIVMIVLALFVPWLPLLLIGGSYSHLQHEVVLALLVGSVNVLITYVALANRLRGRVRLEPYVAACQLLAIASCAVFWRDFGTAGALKLSLTLATVSLTCFFASSVIGILLPDLAKSR